MSGTVPEDGPNELAGLYVLGVLEAAEMQAVREAAMRDAALAAAIAVWEQRLTPLAALAGETVPPMAVWESIERRTAVPSPAMGEIATTSSRRAEKSAGRVLGYWRAAALSAMAVAAGLAAVLAWRMQPQPASRLAVILPLTQTPGGWLIQLRADGSLHAVAQGNVRHAVGQDFELWALADRATKPVPLGLLPTATASADLRPASLPAQRFKLLVSLEPKGGSPTGLPTGPVQFAGEPVGPL